MYRKMIVLSFILVLMFAAYTPAQAISYGEFDGTDHPNVGSMVVEFEGVLYQWCSGTMITSTIFLTASHCDGSSVSLMEALSCGLPAIVSA